MNRPQFLITIFLSCLVLVLFALQVVFSLQAQRGQLKVAWAQQQISQGQACDQRWRQLAARIYEVSQQSQDQTLKDLLAHEQISVKSAPADNSAPTPPPAAPAAAPSDPNYPATH